MAYFFVLSFFVPKGLISFQRTMLHHAVLITSPLPLFYFLSYHLCFFFVAYQTPDNEQQVIRGSFYPYFSFTAV